jgi:predicted HicB family RNase H-like nuclease
MSEQRIYGHTESGKAITDSDIEAIADDAEKGYDVDDLITRRGKRGRPPLGSAPAEVESVRLEPELRNELAERAKAEGVSTSDLIRKALRAYLQPST